MPSLGRLEPFRLSEAKLNGIVAFSSHRFHLYYRAGTGFNRRYRLADAVIPKHLAHAQFLTDDSLQHFLITFGE